MSPSNVKSSQISLNNLNIFCFHALMISLKVQLPGSFLMLQVVTFASVRMVKLIYLLLLLFMNVYFIWTYPCPSLWWSVSLPLPGSPPVSMLRLCCWVDLVSGRMCLRYKLSNGNFLPKGPEDWSFTETYLLSPPVLFSVVCQNSVHCCVVRCQAVSK